MRCIGRLDEARAQAFRDALHAAGIPNEIEQTPDGVWEIWVVPEDRVQEGAALLERFLRDPNAPEFREASRRASERRASEEKARRRREARYVDFARRWAPLGADRLGPVTLALIAASVAVALYSALGAKDERIMALHITAYETRVQGRSAVIEWTSGLPEIRRGQVWRLWTPIFIHYGILHLLFNMWWLKDLGSMVERRQSRWTLLALVLVLGALSNLAQYAPKEPLGRTFEALFRSGPAFGGMSGVLYGLVGYIWIRGRYDPRSGLNLNRSIVTMMIAWFFLCLVGFIGNVANAAHAAGLLGGMAWGWLASPAFRRLFRRR